MKSHEWPKPLWHKDHEGVFLAANEQVYDAACQKGRKTLMDPDPPHGLWGWSKTYIPKSAYDVGQKRVLHGPKGATIHASSKAEEEALLAQGWSLTTVPVSEEDLLTEAQKQAQELETMRQEMKIMREALAGRQGKKHRDVE